jgi:hypothetical protein
MHSRLAMPLVYPLSSATPQMIRRSGQDHGYDHKQIQQALAHLRPLVVGMSKLTHVIKAGHALSQYQAGRTRNVFVQRKKPASQYRLNHIRQQVYQNTVFVSPVGLGTGWDKYGSGRPADALANRVRTRPARGGKN